MYIAFKWLVGLTLSVWFLVCGIDFFIISMKKSQTTGIKEVEGIFKNESTSIKSPPKRSVELNKLSRSKNQRIYGIFHFTVFSAAGFFILIITKKKSFLQLTKNLNNLESSVLYKYLTHLKHRLILRRDDILNYLSHTWGDIHRKSNNSAILNTSKGESLNHVIINSTLLKKLKDVSDEKNSLSLLLAASIFENRNIKYNHKLESLAKKRLEEYAEETEKKMNEALSEKIRFQDLYLISCEENIELRARVKKLTELWEHTGRTLITLVHEVCMSRNEKLIAYCSQFVVQTKDHLLRSDMRAEIQHFLRSTNPIAQFKSLQQPEDKQTLCTKSLVSQGCNTFTPSVSDTPLIARIDGEHICAVKNDDGFIEKLYEYDLMTDFDNVRRIREYSVYHTKDCYYKNTNSWTRIHDNYSGENTNQDLEKFRDGNEIQRHRLVTGSEAFKIFLKNYQQLSLMALSLKGIDTNKLSWKSIKEDGLDLEYTVAMPRSIANCLFSELENKLEYFTGDLTKIKVFGKIYSLPRQQVAYGDPGITYTYSGITVPALAWPPHVLEIRNFIFTLKGILYDFVLVNRYKNGTDHMGEHRDNEPDLDHRYAIASVSLGQERPFVLKHRDSRKRGPDKRCIPPVKINLEHGSILFMNPPTNEIWYHSLPTRKKLLGARINLTFRKMLKKL